MNSPNNSLCVCVFICFPAVFVFSFPFCRKTIKYLEFFSLNDAKNKSIFDYDPSFGADSSGGDIVYKILGIESNEDVARAPSILISKKTRRDQDIVDVIEEEPPQDEQMENLRNLFWQEDSRDAGLVNAPSLRNKMKRIKSSSKSLLNKKITQVKLMSGSNNNTSYDSDDPSLHESQSDISLYKPVVSFRETAAELGSNILRKVKRTHRKSKQKTNDGVGMATLLVRSMMAAPSLDSIAENADVPVGSLQSKTDAKDSDSTASLQTVKKHPHHPHIENKLNISVGDSVIDLKASDGYLSSGVSVSSATISETSSEEDELSELGDEVVMIDADTISM